MWSVRLSFVVFLMSGCTLLFSDDTTEDNPSDHDANDDLSMWGEPKYAYRLPFSVSSPVSEELNNFPVLLTFDSGDLGGRAVPDSSKIKIVHDGDLVPVQREMAPGNTGRVNLWFQVDLIPGERNNYFLYFDSLDGELGDPSSLWDEYTARWNFSDTSPALFFDTAGSNHASVDGSGSLTEGKVGMGVKASISNFPGQVAVVPTPLVGEHICMSVSGWIKPSLLFVSDMARNSLVHSTGTMGEQGTYQLNYIGNDGTPSALIPYTNLIKNIPEKQLSESITVDTWTWLAFNIQDGAAQFFTNGIPTGKPFSMTGEILSLTGGNLHFGGQLNGTMDELRISTACHSNAWMRAEYLSIEAPFPVLSTVESRP